MIGDFSKLEVWEAELYLEVDENACSIFGHLGERPDKATGKEPFLYVNGTYSAGSPPTVQWRAIGKKGTDYDGWIYDLKFPRN